MLDFPMQAYHVKEVSGKLVMSQVTVVGSVPYHPWNEYYIRCSGRHRASMIKRVKKWYLIDKENYDREKQTDYFKGE